jgi:hypothetical protein
MSSAAIGKEPAIMSTDSRKRPAETSQDGSDAKRQRIQPPHTILSLGQLGSSPYSSAAVTADELAKKGLRRGIALALQKVGFEGAAPEAMESFAAMAETCMNPVACRFLGLQLTVPCRYQLARPRHQDIHKLRPTVTPGPQRL